MRVFKKISTPFTKANPDKSIILVNASDPQINTIKCFIQACEDAMISFTICVNKIDLIKESERTEFLNSLKIKLNLKDINYCSSLKDINIEKLKAYLTLWKGKRIIILGIFNSGKTSLINKLCNTNYRVADIPGTTLEFTETNIGNDTIIIDSVGQLIDINKPLMVSIDFSDCFTKEEKINKVFEEEIRGIIQSKETSKASISEIIKVIIDCVKRGNKIIITGAGASALVAKEIAGQGTECGLPIISITNDGAEIQPITFSKGLGEEEGGISRYIEMIINSGDCVIGVSASGGTGFVYDTLKRAKSKGAITISITENPDTPMGLYSNYIIKSDAKPEGPSSSKIQTSHLVIGHTLILVIADEMGLTADESVKHMLPEIVETKKMGIK